MLQHFFTYKNAGTIKKNNNPALFIYKNAETLFFLNDPQVGSGT